MPDAAGPVFLGTSKTGVASFLPAPVLTLKFFHQPTELSR